jgi:hypothetical protein
MKTITFNKTVQMLFAVGIALAFHATVWVIDILVYNS